MPAQASPGTTAAGDPPGMPRRQVPARSPTALRSDAMHTMLRNMMLGATALALTASMVGAATTANAQTSAPTVAPAPASPAAIPGSRVKALQEALSEPGMTVTADGVLDEETRAAIRKYQSQHPLPVTGEPDQAHPAHLGKPAAARGRARGGRK